MPKLPGKSLLPEREDHRVDAITTAVGFLASPTYWVVVISVVGIAAVASAIPGMNSFLVMALAFPFILFEIEEPAIGRVELATIS